MPNKKASPQFAKRNEIKTHRGERILGAQENPLRSLQGVNEEGIYRSATPKTPPICVFMRRGSVCTSCLSHKDRGRWGAPSSLRVRALDGSSRPDQPVLPQPYAKPATY